MPRLIPRRPRWPDDAVLIATATVPARDPNSLRARIYKGEVVRGSDYRVKSHPDLFEEAPVPQGEPRQDEPYAVPLAPFQGTDGRIVGRDERFHLYDPLVLGFPGYFRSIIPNP